MASSKIPPIASMSIVGVVADVKREFQNDFVCERCNVYGIDRREFDAIGAVAEIHPRHFEKDVDRYVVHCNPWKAMRALGQFGYTFTVTPMHGRVAVGEGEKRTCIWTLVSTIKKPE